MHSTIKLFRESLGMKQEEFAEIIDTSKANYSKKENWNVKFSLEDARKISEHFNKPIEDIFFEDEVSKMETYWVKIACIYKTKEKPKKSKQHVQTILHKFK